LKDEEEEEEYNDDDDDVHCVMCYCRSCCCHLL